MGHKKFFGTSTANTKEEFVLLFPPDMNEPHILLRCNTLNNCHKAMYGCQETHNTITIRRNLPHRDIVRITRLITERLNVCKIESHMSHVLFHLLKSSQHKVLFKISKRIPKKVAFSSAIIALIFQYISSKILVAH